MKYSTIILCILFAIIAIFAVSYFGDPNGESLETPPLIQETTPDPAPQTTPPERNTIVHYPVPELDQPVEQQPAAEPEVPGPEDTPEPPLDATVTATPTEEKSIQDALRTLVPNESLFAILRIDNFIQRLVSTIDSLPEKRISQKNLPVNPPDGNFIVNENNDSFSISPENAKRYNPYLMIMKYAPEALVVKSYVYFYPQFQKSYKQLGYQSSYFNDRMIFVIDHLLETPNPTDPIALDQPILLYTYADPLLENLSAGQKTLLRLGQKQRLEVFEILRSYRVRLTNLTP